MESVLSEKSNLLTLKAICTNSVIPLRKENSDTSEMVTQMLFGELCTIVEKKDNWYKVITDYDQYEAWTDYKHLIELTDNQYDTLNQEVHYITDPLQLIMQHNLPFPVTIGAEIRGLNQNSFAFAETEFQFDFSIQKLQTEKKLLPQLSYLFLNTPYLWGGKSTFGIDCSGLMQTIFKLIHIQLPRDAYQQAEIGTVLSFIEEAEAGDLAFFENQEGKITHVGMMLNDHKIIHAHGKVRIDTLDYTGIYNAELQKHTHKLRFIRKII